VCAVFEDPTPMQSSSLRSFAAGLFGLALVVAVAPAQDTAFPPFGNTVGGAPFDIRAAAGEQPWQIRVHHNPQGSGGLMDGLQILYSGRDMAASTGQSAAIGNFTGQGYVVSDVSLAPGEHVRRVDVWFTVSLVTRIRIYTPSTSYTFGDAQTGDTRHNFVAPAGEQIVGFHGRASTFGSIYSLGVISRPLLASELRIGSGCNTSAGQLQMRWRPGRENLIAGTLPVIECTGVPSSSSPIIFYGFTDTSWSGVPLPFDLSVLGSPGCFVYQSLDFAILGPVAPGNIAGHTIDLVNPPAEAIGAPLWFQCVILNSAGRFKTSDSLKVSIGRI
jgi:hypothetical protein